MKKLGIIFILIGYYYVATSSQLLSTQLKVTVINGLGNLVEGATVSIYETENGYRNNQEPVSTLVTNKKGRVTFKKLKTIAYFVDATKEALNNNGEGVQTCELTKGRINNVNIVIE